MSSAQRAGKLGLGGAAIAQQRVERARAVAVADQGEAEVAFAERAVHLAREQLRLDPLGALEPPGGARDPARQQGLQRARWREIGDQRRLERDERFRALTLDDDVVLGAQAVREGIARRARLALRA